jgi:dienelactone hydrolase
MRLLFVQVLTIVMGFVGFARAACPVQPPPAPTDDFQGFKGRVFQVGAVTMPYRLFVPKNYDKANAYPLVLYLHHAGLVGSDNCIQLTEEIGSGGYGGVFVHSATAADTTKFVTQNKYPHFLLAPQAKNSQFGFGGGGAGSATASEHPTRPALYGILDQVRGEYNIDPRRVYVTGISMGCYGTWDIIMRNPTYFAAASPQSCTGDPNTQLLSKLVDSPIWSMCGTADSYFSGAQKMADTMKMVGARAFTFTPFQGVGHSIHDLGYDYPGFIDWMFAQSLPGAADAGVADANVPPDADAAVADASRSDDVGPTPPVPDAPSPPSDAVATGGSGGSSTAGTGGASGSGQSGSGGSGGNAASGGSAARPAQGADSVGCTCSLREPRRSRIVELSALSILVLLGRRKRRPIISVVDGHDKNVRPDLSQGSI